MKKQKNNGKIKQGLKRSLVLYLIFCLIATFFFASQVKAQITLGYRINIPRQAEPGGEAVLQAQPEGFKLGYSQYNWCIFGKTYQSIQAGSGDEFIDKDGNLGNRFGKLEGKLSCGAIAMAKTGDKVTKNIRMPAVVTNPKSNGEFGDGSSFGGPTAVKRSVYDPAKNDIDGDGMHDEWEILHFRKFAGKTVERGCAAGVCIYTFPSYDPTNPRPFLEYIKRDTDFDNDGWSWEKAYSECKENKEDFEGQPCRFPHAESMDFGYGDCCDDGIGCDRESDFCNWPKDGMNATGMPSAEGVQTGDGKFTNWEEYVFGLDPTSPDTDQDGIQDEADVAGYKGKEARIKLNKEISQIGRKIPVVSVIYGLKVPGVKMPSSVIWVGAGVGAATGAAIGVWFFGVGAAVGAAIGALLGAGLSWLIGLFGGDVRGNFILMAALDSTIVAPGPPLQVTLSSDPEVPIPESGTEAGYPPVKVTASVTGVEEHSTLYYKWYIQNTDILYEGYGKSEFEFKVKDSPFNKFCQYNTITCDVQDEETGRLGSADLELEIGENITEEKLHAELVGTRAAEEGPVEDPCGPNMDVDGGFVRVGDIIKVQADLEPFCKTCPPDCPEKYPDSDEAKDFIYQWYLDGKEQVDQSGQEKKDFKFTVTKPPGDEHLVKLKLIRISDGFEYGQLGEKVFTVQAPQAPIESGTAFGCDEQETGLCRVILEPNETQKVDFKTTLENFQPTYAETFHYTWTFDGEVVKEENTTEAENILTYEFTHPGEIEEEQIKTHTIVLTVDNYIDSDESVDESASDTYTVEVVLKTAGGGARGPVTRLFAQAGQTISNYFRNIFNIVLSIGVIGFIVFVVMATGQFRKKE